MSKLRVGLALCGSYCTYDKIMGVAERLTGEYDVTPIMSESSATTNSRYGAAEDFKKLLSEFTGKEVIDTITKAEPIGPKALLDVLVIAPCTGNTVSKIAQGITDSTVTMAAKAHLRNARPVIIALSTNDGLSGSASNIGSLLNRKNIYFVPFYQDDPGGKPTSVVADFDLIEETISSATQGKQLQPLLLVRD